VWSTQRKQNVVTRCGTTPLVWTTLSFRCSSEGPTNRAFVVGMSLPPTISTSERGPSATHSARLCSALALIIWVSPSSTGHLTSRDLWPTSCFCHASRRPIKREGDQVSQSIPDPCAKGREHIRARRTTAVVAAIDAAFKELRGGWRPAVLLGGLSAAPEEEALTHRRKYLSLVGCVSLRALIGGLCLS